MGKHMNKSIMLRILVMALLVSSTLYFILIGVSTARSYSIYDIEMERAAIEVVLNKPSIQYDWSSLKNLRNVIPVEYTGTKEAYAYRSHYDKELIVIVSLQTIKHPKEGEHFITIRIQSPLLNISEIVYHSSITIPDEVSVDKDYIEKLGWKIESQIEKETKEKEFKVTSIRLSKSMTQNTTITINIMTVWRKGKPETTISIVIKAEKLRDIYINEVNKVLKHIANVNVSKEEFKRLVNPRFKPKFNEDDLKNALLTELKWLRDVGVIKGLTDKDIGDIVKCARIGYSGWNGRLIYYEGKWYPYYKVVKEIGGVLLKTTGASIKGLELLPKEPPQQTKASTITTVVVEEESQWNRYKGLILALALASIIAIVVYLVVRRA